MLLGTVVLDKPVLIPNELRGPDPMVGIERIERYMIRIPTW